VCFGPSASSHTQLSLTEMPDDRHGGDTMEVNMLEGR
jgi:hypothetical protein